MAVDFPASPSVGQQFNAAGMSWQWDGVKWVAYGGGSFAPVVFVGDVPPSTPSPGTLWWDSVGLQMYLYFADGTSTQWCPATNYNGPLAEAPADSNYYARRNNAWTGIGSTLSAAQDSVGRNLLMNPLFAVQQRGQGGWSTNYAFTADRWQLWVSGDTHSISIYAIADSARAQIGDEWARYTLTSAVTGTSGATAYSRICQCVESVYRLAGKTVIISFYANGPVGAKIGVSVGQTFGVGGSPSADVVLNGQSVTLGSSWARYSVSVAIPSVAGKTLGTSGDDRTLIWFWLNAGSNYTTQSGGVPVQSGTFTFWGMQLEVAQPGQTAPSALDYGGTQQQQLAQCQRYYQRNGMLPGWTISASIMSVHWTPIVPMRAAPTANLLTTTPYGEQPPWATGRTGSGSTVNNTHNTQQNNAGLGYDLQITGFSGMTANLFCTFGALQLEFTADI